MVDTMRVARHSIVHKLPRAAKQRDRVTRQVRLAGRGLTETHSVYGMLLNVCESVLYRFQGSVTSEDCGGLAQLVERLPCKQEVSGSTPLISTTYGSLAQSVRALA